MQVQEKGQPQGMQEKLSNTRRLPNSRLYLSSSTVSADQGKGYIATD